MLPIKTVIVIYILWNCYVFIAMGRDKRRAKLKRWRISEATLLWMGAIFGGVGLLVGMKFFHHKTAHPRFIYGAPLLILLNAVVLGFLISKHVIG